MSVKHLAVAFALVALCFTSAATAQTIIAGWDQNDNGLPNGGFGFVPSDFPQPNDHGPASATHDIANFDGTIEAGNLDGKYEFVESFAGTTDNDLTGSGSGGSFSFEGSQNNGAMSVFSVPTTGYTDILVSWSQRGTSTGYDSRVFEYSTDGGSNWIDIGPYTGSAGALTSTFSTVSLDLSSVSALDSNPDAMFRITYDGASSVNGNNRWDSFYVQGAIIPEPTTAVLLMGSLVGLGAMRRRR